MKKIKVNGIFVPTPAKLKWEANKNDTETTESVNAKLEMAPIVPTQWQGILKRGGNFDEKYDDIKEVSYELIYEERPSAWITNNEPLPLNKLPIRLYNVKENDIKKGVEDINEESEVENYATLSYVWGGDYNKESGELSPGGKKSLKKAIEACNYLGIKYLWIDQLCINQNDWKEKAQEVPKMRQYYNNGAVTLVSIQKNILDDNGKFPSQDEAIKSIISSEWFSRSWTFQEGWLSKQTIFMFDDALIDGRDLASHWALQQPAYSEHGKYNNLQEFNQGVKKIATPIGWVYCKDGYNSKDKMSLSLNQALRSIKERKRSLAIDGVYSILGLLPYGENKEIKVDYSLSTQEALRNIMKIAVQEGYGEPLAWHGIGNDWIPDIDNVGSSTVLGGISIDYVPKNASFIKPSGIEINGVKLTVEKLLDSVSNQIAEGFTIDGGIYKRNVLIKFVNKDNNYIKQNIKLLGTSGALEKMKESDFLLIPNNEEWKSDTPFAILVSRKGSSYQRIGLVEFYWETGIEKLEGVKREKIVIGGLDVAQESKQIEQEFSNLQLQSQIQIPPK